MKNLILIVVILLLSTVSFGQNSIDCDIQISISQTEENNDKIKLNIITNREIISVKLFTSCGQYLNHLYKVSDKYEIENLKPGLYAILVSYNCGQNNIVNTSRCFIKY